MKTNLTRVKTWIFCTAALLSIGCGSVTAQAFSTIKTFGILTNVSGFNPHSQLVQGGDGILYGTTYSGEPNVAGTVFKVQPDGSNFAVLKLFTNSIDGASPRAGLTLSGNVLYGTTENGGSSGQGTLFKLNTDGTGFTVLKSFAGPEGMNPTASLVLDGGVLYGTTTNGGSSSLGTLFKVNTNGQGFTVLKDFNGGDGANPSASLTLADNVLYGTASAGGSADAGVVFKLNTDGTGYTVLKEFTGFDGAKPFAGLTLSGTVLYGTTSAGGGGGEGGTIFRMQTDGTGFVVLKDSFGPPTEYPSGNLTLDGTVLYGTTSEHDISNFGTVFKINTDGTGYTVLKELTGNDGFQPQAGLLLSSNILYGTAAFGGSSGQGTVFNLNTDGIGFTVLKHFAFSDASTPQAGLASSGNMLYGTTYSGGSAAKGTVFLVNTDGTGYTVLKNFTGADGEKPFADLTVSGNMLYGTTERGGSSGQGTVFKMNTDGTGHTVLKHCTPSDGRNPLAGLTLAGDVLYGTTSLGGSLGAGTVFKINTNGTGYTVLKHFNLGDGSVPWAGLTLSGNALYGTTFLGGSSARGTLFRVNTDGTGFTVLKHFNDEANPQATPTLNGTLLYGTTRNGGSSGRGTVFRVNTDGTDYAVLKDFTGSDGASPQAGLILFNGVLYGTTANGGSPGSGTVFKLNTDGTGYAVLKHFTGSDGSNPLGDLTLFSDVLYGTTQSGGSLEAGTVFKLNVAILLECTNRVVECDMEWTIIPPTVVDPSCSNPSPPVLTGVVTNGATCAQVITLNWQYTNCLQQTASCNQNISIVDSTPPMVICPTNKTVQCGTDWSFDAPTGIDSCWGTNLTITPAGPPETNSLCPLIVEQMWSIFDGCGNPAFCSQLVTLVNTNPPTLVCPTNMLVKTYYNNAVEVHWALSSSAPCGDLAGVASFPPSGTAFLPETTNTVTAWAWTACLTNSCTFTVTVYRLPNFLGFNTGPFHSVVGAFDLPTEGAVLQLLFKEPLAQDTFVPITSSDPTVLIVSGGEVGVAMGATNAVVPVTSHKLGNVTLTASYEGTQATAEVNVVSGIPMLPALSIETLPDAVRLVWPTNAEGFLLETNSTVATPADWGVFASNYFILGTNYVVTNLFSDPARFFRLHKP